MDQCIFNHADAELGEAIGLFFLPEGCQCFPDDQLQFLCEHHLYECTDICGIHWVLYWGA